ncbi:MAG: OadG family protein [Bacteroidales bacterium]|nr:OadG family protein [Bacteroidales bacterium]
MIPGSITFDVTKISGNEIMISIVGYVIVFIALVVLYFVFFNLPKVIKFNIRRKLLKLGKIKQIDSIQEDISGEVNAAISMALYLHFNELHDEESHIMTIKRVARTYSPWSSKIYSVRNYFNRP